jgi:hypothetical protein
MPKSTALSWTTPRRNPQRVDPHTNDTDKKVLEMGLYGVGFKGIASRTGYSVSMVGYRLGKAGVSVKSWRNATEGFIDDAIADLESRFKRCQRVLRGIDRVKQLKTITIRVKARKIKAA